MKSLIWEVFNLNTTFSNEHHNVCLRNLPLVSYYVGTIYYVEKLMMMEYDMYYMSRVGRVFVM